MKTNSINTFVLASVTAAILAACGGGGGGGTLAPVATTPTPAASTPTPAASTPATQVATAPDAPTVPTLAITATNAKAVAAHALAQASNGLVVWAGAAPLINGTAFLLPTLNLVGSIVINADTIKAKVLHCGAGGAVFLTGTVAGTTGLVAGDVVNSDYQYCSPFVAGSNPIFIGGTASQTVISGGASAMPFQIAINSKFTNLNTALQKNFGVYSENDLLNGDERLDWTAASTTEQTLLASGTSLSNKTTVGTVVRNHVWQNYQITTAISGANTSLSFSGLVQTDNSNLGGSGGIYSLSTPTPLAKVTTTNVMSSGVLKAVGTSNSAVLITVGAGGAVTVQVDANGDGIYETSIPTTMAELNTYL